MPAKPAKIIQDLLGKLIAKDEIIKEFHKDLKEKVKTIDLQDKLLERQLERIEAFEADLCSSEDSYNESHNITPRPIDAQTQTEYIDIIENSWKG